MPVYPMIFVIVAFSFMAIGTYVLFVNFRAGMNKIFALSCFSFGLWSFFYMTFITAGTAADAWVWYRLSGISWILSPVLVLHFFLLFSRPEVLKRNSWMVVFFYLPPIPLIIRMSTQSLLANGLMQAPWGWRESVDPQNPWAIACFFYLGSYVFMSFYFLLRSPRFLRHPAMNRKVQVIAGTGVLALVLGLFSNIVLPAVGNYSFPSLAPVVFLIWMWGVLFAIVRYRLLMFSPAVAVQDILETMADPLILVDWDHQILEVNPAAEELFGKQVKDLSGTSIHDLFPEDPVFRHINSKNLTREEPLRNREISLAISNQPEDMITLSLSASAVFDRYDHPVGYVAIFRDITDLKRAQNQLRFLVTHDPLTDLPNRVLIRDRLHSIVIRAKRYKNCVGVFMLDMDDFKRVNDTLGHRVGDDMIKRIALRLQSILRDTDTVGRVAGDEFIIITELEKEEDASSVAAKIIDLFKHPFQIGDITHHLSASVGVSIYPSDGEDLESLIKDADMAMYRAKERGKGNFQFYSRTLSFNVRKRMDLENDLRQALKAGQFKLHYQPIVDLESGETVSMESLLRWEHPVNGNIPPMEFIPFAERSNLIIDIGDWVMETGARQLKQWENEGYKIPPISINFSSKQFQDPSIVDRVYKIMKNIGLPINMLYLEITETTAFTEPEKSLFIMRELNNLGAKIVIDDFGAGYSSFWRLRQIPAYAIKIDRYFIQGIGEDGNLDSVVMAIIAMAHSLNLKVVAEGVETEDQLQKLRSLKWKPNIQKKCDTVQGYLTGRPVPSEEFAKKFLVKK